MCSDDARVATVTFPEQFDAVLDSDEAKVRSGLLWVKVAEKGFVVAHEGCAETFEEVVWPWEQDAVEVYLVFDGVFVDCEACVAYDCAWAEGGALKNAWDWRDGYGEAH